MAYLVLVRHGQSEWNALSKWTGWTDVGLTKKGEEEARAAAKKLHGITLHQAHSSELIRASKTLELIKEALGNVKLPTQIHKALNERDYGIYTGKNKWQVKEDIGEEEFTKLRRYWNYPVPEGETLKDVHDRTVPYYEEHILDNLKDGKNVIVAAHGNTLRALMKHLDDVAYEDVHKLEIGTGELHIYEINEDGQVTGKTIRN